MYKIGSKVKFKETFLEKFNEFKTVCIKEGTIAEVRSQNSLSKDVANYIDLYVNSQRLSISLSYAEHTKYLEPYSTNECKSDISSYEILN